MKLVTIDSVQPKHAAHLQACALELARFFSSHNKVLGVLLAFVPYDPSGTSGERLRVLVVGDSWSGPFSAIQARPTVVGEVNTPAQQVSLDVLGITFHDLLAALGDDARHVVVNQEVSVALVGPLWCEEVRALRNYYNAYELWPEPDDPGPLGLAEWEYAASRYSLFVANDQGGRWEEVPERQ